MLMAEFQLQYPVVGSDQARPLGFLHIVLNFILPLA